MIIELSRDRLQVTGWEALGMFIFWLVCVIVDAAIAFRKRVAHRYTHSYKFSTCLT
ncbi:MAG TPA: hypothetical protein V6D25_08695 [Leptolyngbyaceae cyanobacterium]